MIDFFIISLVVDYVIYLGPLIWGTWVSLRLRMPHAVDAETDTIL